MTDIDSTVYEFRVTTIPDEPFVTPLAKGHFFYLGDEGLEWVAEGERLVNEMIEEASRVSGKKLAFQSWWVSTLDDVYSTTPNENGVSEGMGDHIEGTTLDDWTLLLALNDLPEGAGAPFRLVEREHGPVVGKKYPHEKGRGVMFKSMHWHGNEPLKFKCDRVSVGVSVREL